MHCLLIEIYSDAGRILIPKQLLRDLRQLLPKNESLLWNLRQQRKWVGRKFIWNCIWRSKWAEAWEDGRHSCQSRANYLRNLLWGTQGSYLWTINTWTRRANREAGNIERECGRSTRNADLTKIGLQWQRQRTAKTVSLRLDNQLQYVSWQIVLKERRKRSNIPS